MKQNDNTPEMSLYDRELLDQFFSGLDRQGPGSDTETLKALRLIKDYLPSNPRILDIGCGTGRQSMTIAKTIDCSILSVDISPIMIKGVEERMRKEHLTNKVTPLVGNMEQLPFDQNFFDVIWSEGAIYNIGFEEGLKTWMPFLKPGAFLVVTDAAWTSDQRPPDSTWLLNNMLDMKTIAQKLETIQQVGYQPFAHFVLPQRAWEENYYQPMERHINYFLETHPDDSNVKQLMKQLTTEIQYYRENHDFYGYMFFIARKM